MKISNVFDSLPKFLILMVDKKDFRKPKTKRGKRFLQNRESKVIENTKQALFVKGGRTNEIITKSLKEFVKILL